MPKKIVLTEQQVAEGDAKWEDEPDDLDPNNPVDLSAEAWADIYADMDDYDSYLDHDHSMDY